jgi:hypothetical protein
MSSNSSENILEDDPDHPWASPSPDKDDISFSPPATLDLSPSNLDAERQDMEKLSSLEFDIDNHSLTFTEPVKASKSSISEKAFLTEDEDSEDNTNVEIKQQIDDILKNTNCVDDEAKEEETVAENENMEIAEEMTSTTVMEENKGKDEDVRNDDDVKPGDTDGTNDNAEQDLVAQDKGENSIASQNESPCSKEGETDNEAIRESVVADAKEKNDCAETKAVDEDQGLTNTLGQESINDTNVNDGEEKELKETDVEEKKNDNPTSEIDTPVEGAIDLPLS